MTSRTQRPLASPFARGLTATAVLVALLAGLAGCGDDQAEFAGGVRIDELAVQNVAVNVTTTTATIAWITRDNLASAVRYGTTSALGSEATAPEEGTTHEVLLTGLQPDTLYFYRVTGLGATWRFRTLGGARQRLAFVSDAADNRQEVYLSYEWQENQTRVTTTGGHSPALSADGTRLAWVARGAGGRDDVFMAQLDTAGVIDGTTVNLTNSADRAEYAPDWSPDGTRLVFGVAQPGQPSQLVLYTVLGGAETVALSDLSALDDPAWSPNGNQLAFASPLRTATEQLNRRPLDPGSLEVRLRDDNQTLVPASTYTVLDNATALIDFSASPAADRGVVVRYTSNGVAVSGEEHRIDRPQSEIWTVNLNGTNLLRLTDNTNHDTAPDWLSNTLLTFSSEASSSTLISTVDTSRAQRRLTSGSERDRHPAASPDGTQVVFSSDRSFTRLINLYRVATDGTGLIELALTAASETQPAWSQVP